MARPRKITPDIMVLRMAEVISKILTMNDTEIGAWFRKAAVDVMNGCKDPNCDPLIRQQFERALQELQKRQEHNATMYRNRLARQGKSLKINDQETTSISTPETISTNEAGNPPTRESETRGPQTDNFNRDAATSDGAEADSTRESGLLALTTISNISQDAPNGNAGDENLVHPAPIAESATRTSEAVKALADASTREGEDERDHRGNTGIPESSSSAKKFTLDSRTDKDRQPNRRTGGTPKRVEMPTASHAETLPVRSPAELKKPYGTCGHVMLTDTEGRHLREVYGPHLAIAIDILDGYIENDGKAAKKYKNHAAVLRKGNWVWNKVQEMILNEKRIENASKQGDRRSFRQQEREHQTELMHKSLFAPSIGMDDREVTNG